MRFINRIRIWWNEHFHKAEMDAKLREMHYQDGVTNAVLEFPGVAIFASEFAAYFDKVGAPNWVEFTVMDRPSMRVFVITVQRKGGETPAQKIKRLEAELIELQQEAS